MKIPVKITLTEEAKALYPNGQPEYASDGASGFDLRATGYNTGKLEDKFYILKPDARIVVCTGLKLAIPQGYELQIRPRSGFAIKHGITVLNTPATIDNDYRGEIMICLYNTSNEDFKISVGDRIAQGIIAPVFQAGFEVVNKLNKTDRGSGGFGSTGVK